MVGRWRTELHTEHAGSAQAVFEFKRDGTYIADLSFPTHKRHLAAKWRGTWELTGFGGNQVLAISTASVESSGTTIATDIGTKRGRVAFAADTFTMTDALGPTVFRHLK